jgi:hypothetical protein
VLSARPHDMATHMFGPSSRTRDEQRKVRKPTAILNANRILMAVTSTALLDLSATLLQRRRAPPGALLHADNNIGKSISGSYKTT